MTAALALMTACAAIGAERADPLIGTWRGQAVFRDATLTFEVRFFRERDTLRGTFSSPDLLLLDQPLDSVRQVGARIDFDSGDEQPIRFRGRLAGDTIRGGAAVPDVPGVNAPDAARARTTLQFALVRAAAPGARPYESRAVRIASGGVQLSGTVLSPRAGSAVRAGVVILQGSSGNLRHDYQFYADHFARAGFAVLSFDKRGNGQSSGNYGAATYDDLASDAAAAVEFLRRQPGVDSMRVGVWGLSQGAFIAPMVARRVPSLRFVVAVSPPGVAIGESAAYQDSVRLVAAGFAAGDARAAAQFNRRILGWLRAGGSPVALDADLARTVRLTWSRASSLPRRLPSGPSLEGWYWRGRTLDPLPSWRVLHTPALVLFGAADELVPAEISADHIGQALRDGGNRDATVRLFPAANHMLRTLPLIAGGKWDWPRAAPGYLEAVVTWMQDHAR